MLLLFILLLILLIIVSYIYRHELQKYAAITCQRITGGAEFARFREFIDPVFHTQEKYNVKPELYQNIHSNNQIRTVIKYGNPAEYARLINLLGRHIDVKNNADKQIILNRLLDMPDKTAYAKLGEYMHRDENERGSYQAKSLYRPLYTFAPERRYAKYLDIGCGNGNITREFAKLIGATSTDCVEVSEFADKSINYHIIDPKQTVKLPYPDNHFDLITCFMSLHHMTNLNDMLAEITRVLSPGGVLFIKEHDSWNAMDFMLVDIEHAIFLFNLDNDKTFKDYYLNHMNMDNWRDLLGKKLKYEAGDFFYTAYRKEISPTRAAWQIYSKA